MWGALSDERTGLSFTMYSVMAAGPRYIALAWTAQRTLIPTALLLLHVCLSWPFPSNMHCLQSHYSAMAIV
jgi:hypothetical protein